MLEAHPDVGRDILGICEPDDYGPVKAIVNSRRNLCLAILLGLLVGHASLVAHAATHDVGDAFKCELCISHGAPAAVPDTGSCHEFDALPPVHVESRSAGDFATRFISPYDVRGPPV